LKRRLADRNGQKARHQWTASSVLLHAAVAILWFLTFWRMTEELWPSALAAAIFAVHPL
jgi:hypothetical protein